LLRRDFFEVLTNIDVAAFIPTRGHTCVETSRSGLGAKLTTFESTPNSFRPKLKASYTVSKVLSTLIQ